MEAGRSRSRDVVGTFLETVGSSSGSAAQSAYRPRPATAESAVPASEDSPVSGQVASEPAQSPMQLVLTHLEGPGEAPLTELAAGLGMPMLEVAGLLNKLTTTGLVAIEGEPGREMVILTESGRTIAELA